MGPKLLGRADDSGVNFYYFTLYFLITYADNLILKVETFLLLLLRQRLIKDLVKILNQVNSEKIPDNLKLPDSFSQLVSEMKNNKFSSKEFALILKGMVSIP